MSNFIKDISTGFYDAATNPKGLVANWQHATKIFVDGQYRLSPRTKYLFYVQFEIDRAALKSELFTPTHTDEVGMLVKSTSMPKFKFDTVTKSQYNRKKLVYKTINYEPVNISLHDDTAGLVNSLWALYYGYYIADRHQSPITSYAASRYNGNIINSRYGLDNNVSTPFFKSVSIYTMSRKRFHGYKLINPIITSWNHGDLDYFDGETISSDMTLEYEAVIYSAGNVTYDNPKGFASLHYDKLPSPLTVQGGGVDNLFGEGGVLDGVSRVLDDVTSGTALSSPEGMIGTAIAAMNTYKNIGDLTKKGLKNEVNKLLLSQTKSILAPLAVTAGMAALGSVGGVVGSVFPKTDGVETTASAKVTPSAVTSLQAAEVRANPTRSASTRLAAAEANLQANSITQSSSTRLAAAESKITDVQQGTEQ